jgi:hypothetical protein
MSISEDAAIAIDRTTLQSVYTRNQPGMAPDRCTADRVHPTVRTLDSYGPILHPALKTVPLRRGGTGTVKHPRDQLPGSSYSYERVKNKINSGPKAINSKRMAIKIQKRAKTSLERSLRF